MDNYPGDALGIIPVGDPNIVRVDNANDSRLLAPLPDNGLFLREIVISLRQRIGKVSTIKLLAEQFVTLTVPLMEHKTAKPGEHGK